jgi:hypothetical protein
MDAAYVLDGLNEPALTRDGDSRIHFSLVYLFGAQ